MDQENKPVLMAEIPVNVLQSVLNYLSRQPYADVRDLVDLVVKNNRVVDKSSEVSGENEQIKQ